ncbi:MAG: hypothetical protein AVDCRST_MAG01-01-3131, partial [uncultured Rubrobacteraceae bacterium]
AGCGGPGDGGRGRRVRGTGRADRVLGSRAAGGSRTGDVGSRRPL